ncbi:MAG: glycogen/starch/alpha-glucan phosphorylase, partial [Eubacteriales bacterium]|nr:glycogen/starch/alpha-glucan phosphorylase [Eubacteriales bacterium]
MDKLNTAQAVTALKDDIRKFIAAGSGKRPEAATKYEKWIALTKAVMSRIGHNWYDTNENYAKGRQAHYFSAEFLVGRSLVNNLINLGIYEEADEALKEFGTSLSELEDQESDPGLGNGGLGRLAACFLDSAATHDLPVTGYGSMYRYGLFRQ